VSTSENPVGTSAATTAGPHTIRAVAKDSTGHTFSVSHLVHAYYEFTCDPRGDTCTPGIVIQSPDDEQYVNGTFLVDAAVLNNTSPITSMKAYVGNTLVASSSGPTLYQHVSAANGTHVLRVDAVDTKGRLYRSMLNVNVNVAH
jgi:Big-like domain-containing protein